MAGGKDVWISFDCYGTLINWFDGRRKALEPFVPEHQVDEAVRALSKTEKAIRSVGPFEPYRSVTRIALEQVGDKLGFTVPSGNPVCDSTPNWTPFPDVVPALNALCDTGAHLALISNIDDDIIKETIKTLGVPFDEIVTSQQVRAYKPSLEPFRELQRRRNLARCAWVHVAYNLHVDVLPAHEMGIPTVWVNRLNENTITSLGGLGELPGELDLH